MSWQVALYIGIAGIVALFGRNRGLNLWLMWFLSIGFTPIGGYIIVRIFGNRDYDAKPFDFDIGSLLGSSRDEQVSELNQKLDSGSISRSEYDRRINQLYDR